MVNFEYENGTKLVFGKGTHKEIGKQIKEYTSNVLIVHGSNRIKENDLLNEIEESLEKEGISYTELGGVVPNPRVSLVREGISICKDKDINFVIAVGGGSVIDTAKAIGFGTFYNGDVWDFFSKGVSVRKTLKVATILTIPASGSESSANAVISDETIKEKRVVKSELIRPVLSIVDPELFYSIPKNQIAYGICDMMSHIFERYFTNTSNNDVIDAMSEAVTREIIKNGKLLFENNQNYESWSEIAIAGNLAHNGIFGMGKDEEWTVHALEYQLSAYYDIPHGAGIAILLPAWMRYVYAENKTIFKKFAINIMEVKDNGDDDYVINEGINRLEAYFVSLGLPNKLSMLNIDTSKIDEMSKKVTQCDKVSIGKIKKLYSNDVKNIFEMVR